VAIVSKSQTGFTIVELLVVIVIIGILVTIGIVAYGPWRQSLNKSQLHSDLHALAATMEDARNFSNALRRER